MGKERLEKISALVQKAFETYETKIHALMEGENPALKRADVDEFKSNMLEVFTAFDKEIDEWQDGLETKTGNLSGEALTEIKTLKAEIQETKTSLSTMLAELKQSIPPKSEPTPPKEPAPPPPEPLRVRKRAWI